MRRITDNSKEIIPAIKDPSKRPTTRVFLNEDVHRLHDHKELMMDWLFTEMEEHSKKLQMYADWYDYFQRGINIEEEFQLVMRQAAATFPPLADNNEFLNGKRR